MKAALLSALVFPGVGHLFLKKYKSAVILLGISLFGVFYLTSKVLEIASQLAEKIQNSGAPLDVMELTKLVSDQTNSADNSLLSMTTTILLICWIVAAVDSYRVGRVDDKQINEKR